jgi:hypothetical protein
VSLDDWVRKNNIQLVENVVLKIDVEGQEEQAMRGARNLITASKRALVLLEIHPEVLEKTSTSPEQLFETLESIRSVDWLVPMMGNCSVDRNKPFFQQFERKQYDLIGVLK